MPGSKLIRRSVLTSSATSAIGDATGAGGTATGMSHSRQKETPKSSQSITASMDTVPFRGGHQTGIVDATPSHASLLALDLADATTTGMLAVVMRAWAQLAGSLAHSDASVDTSSLSSGSLPAIFTITVGVGRSALEQLGLGRPPGLAGLPSFAGDQLDPGVSDGEVFVQLCSNDAPEPAAAARAVRRAAAATLPPRWQLAASDGPRRS